MDDNACNPKEREEANKPSYNRDNTTHRGRNTNPHDNNDTQTSYTLEAAREETTIVTEKSNHSSKLKRINGRNDKRAAQLSPIQLKVQGRVGDE